MAKFKEKIEALKMRKEGNSIGDIANRLHVSKSTVSDWCRDIPLSKKAIALIADKSKSKRTRALLSYSETLRIKRQQLITLHTQEGKNLVGKLNPKDIFHIGLGLYWGEGYKKGSQEFGFTNSDPQMILFYIFWLRACFRVELHDLILRVSVNETHRRRINEIEVFWSRLTGVPRTQFTKPSLIKTRNKKVYSNNNHMGTLRIKVRKGTRLKRITLGAIGAIVQQIHRS